MRQDASNHEWIAEHSWDLVVTTQFNPCRYTQVCSLFPGKALG